MDNFSIVPLELRQELEKTLKILFHEATHKLKADHAFIAYIDRPYADNKPKFFNIQPALWQKRPGEHPLLLEVTEGVSGMAVSKDCALLFPGDAGTEKVFRGDRGVVVSEIVIPLHYNNRCTGVLLMDIRHGKVPFSKAELRVAKEFGLLIDRHLRAPEQARKELYALAEECRQRTSSTRGYIAVKAFDSKLEYFSVGEGVEAFLPLSATEGLCGDVFQTGRSINIGKVLDNQDYVSSAAEIQSECIFPVKLKGLVLAIVNMECVAVEHYTEQRIAVMDEIARRAQSLITAHRPVPDVDYFYGLWNLFENMIYTLNQSAKDASLYIWDNMIERLCEAAEYVTGGEAVFWDRVNSKPLPQMFSRIPDAETALEKGAIHHCDNRSFIIYDPLRSDGDHLGTLGVRIDGIYDEADASKALDQLNRLIGVVSISFKRRQLQIQQQQYLNALHCLSRSEVSWSDLDAIIQEIPQILDCTGCALFYRREISDSRFYLGPSSCQQFVFASEESYYSADQPFGLIPYCIATGKTVCVNNVTQIPKANAGDVQGSTAPQFSDGILEEPRDCYRSILIAPLLYENEIVGVMRCYRNKESTSSGFGIQDTQMLETICALSAHVVASDPMFRRSN